MFRKYWIKQSCHAAGLLRALTMSLQGGNAIKTFPKGHFLRLVLGNTLGSSDLHLLTVWGTPASSCV
jgi:hypothetical protein